MKRCPFSVPTGNFGDIFAGYIAKGMGLPIEQLIVATNSNDILHRFFSANNYAKQELKPTLSPSMDIMVSSNFEHCCLIYMGVMVRCWLTVWLTSMRVVRWL